VSLTANDVFALLTTHVFSLPSDHEQQETPAAP